MHAKSTVALALVAATTVSAGTTTLLNKCSFPVYFSTVSDFAAPVKTLQSGETYNESYLTNPNGGGVSVKIAKDPSLASATQFEYTLMPGTLWYDLSNINGDPFQADGMSLMTSDPNCRNVLCPAGNTICKEAYNQPFDDWATAGCNSVPNTALTLCAGSDHTSNPLSGALGVSNNKVKDHKKHHHKEHHHKKPAPAPAPAPVPTVAPIVPAVAGAMTTFVTQVVTVTARDAAPSIAAEPRAVHRHHFHRHGHKA